MLSHLPTYIVGVFVVPHLINDLIIFKSYVSFGNINVILTIKCPDQFTCNLTYPSVLKLTTR